MKGVSRRHGYVRGRMSRWSFAENFNDPQNHRVTWKQNSHQSKKQNQIHSRHGTQKATYNEHDLKLVHWISTKHDISFWGRSKVAQHDQQSHHLHATFWGHCAHPCTMYQACSWRWVSRESLWNPLVLPQNDDRWFSKCTPSHQIAQGRALRSWTDELSPEYWNQTWNQKLETQTIQLSTVPHSQTLHPQVEVSDNMVALQLVCPCFDILLKGLHKLHGTARRNLLRPR